MIDARQISQVLRDAEMDVWADLIEKQLHHRLNENLHGHTELWKEAVSSLPVVSTKTAKLDQGLIQIGAKPDSTVEIREQIESGLRALEPWRKGPYQIHGVFVDTEWRSDWKWERVIAHIEPLEDRRVLDVGCGNGYHCWRMAGEGAELVIGIDPTQLFHMQFLAVKHFISSVSGTENYSDRVHYLPLGIEQVPRNLRVFDTVFSMGVLYHRRSPIDHLQELKGTLRSGGQLVLETLVIEGDEQHVLVPEGRYAKMRNVWFIPSVKMLELWLSRAGFRAIRTVDVTSTSSQEQRSTDWMRFESLADFLDPADTDFTLEGYPAPRRAIVLAEA